MNIDGLDDLLVQQPAANGAMPFDDPAMMQADEEIAAPAVHTGETPFDPQRLIENIENPNIAADMDDDELSKIGQKVHREYELDLGTRSEWEERSKKAMDLAMQIAKPKSSPWPGASNIVYPLMTTAAIQFAARAYPAIIQGRNVVKGVVVGPDDGTPMLNQEGKPVMLPDPSNPQAGPQVAWITPPGAKKIRATRIGEHMSWQLLEEQTEWVEQTDKLLHILPIVGCAFRKTLFDRGMGCNAALLVMAQNLVINYHAESMERAPRLTECLQFYPTEIEEQVRADLFIDHPWGTAQNSNGDDDAPHEFLEQHRLLDLDEDGYPEPYIVTLHKQTMKVARIAARYDAEGVHISRTSGKIVKIDPVHYYTKYDFLPNPDNGIYGVGFGQLLVPINESVNTTLNMLFDAGSLQNTGGGFIGRGPSMHSGSLKFRLGEWKTVNVPGQSMRDAIVPLNHPGPSAQLIALLQFLVEAGREVASVKDILAGDVQAQTMQPTTLLALIEQGLKVFTGIFKRVQWSLGKEFDKLYRLNRIYLENQAKYKAGDEWKTITQADYASGAGVQPVSDPTMVTDMQRMAKAQFLQSYQNDPLCDGVEIRKRVMDAAQIEEPDKIVHGKMPPDPTILAKTTELELKGAESEAKVASMKATQIKDLSAAVLNLANADKANGDMDLAFTAQHIDLLEMQLKSLLAPADAKPGQAGQGAMPPMPEEMPGAGGGGMSPPPMPPEAGPGFDPMGPAPPPTDIGQALMNQFRQQQPAQ